MHLWFIEFYFNNQTEQTIDIEVVTKYGKSIGFTKKHFQNYHIFFDTLKCAADYVILFKVYDGFILGRYIVTRVE